MSAKDHPSGRHGIQLRRFYGYTIATFLMEYSNVTVAKVISENKNDIWLFSTQIWLASCQTQGEYDQSDNAIRFGESHAVVPHSAVLIGVSMMMRLSRMSVLAARNPGATAEFHLPPIRLGLRKLPRNLGS